MKPVDTVAEFIPDGSAEQVELLTVVDTRADLPRIAVPTLVVATTADGWLQLRLLIS